MNKIAFIPARSGSKRIPNKNIKFLNGHPLIAYSITAAIQSNIFESVVCVTDDKLYESIANYYGAEVPILRPKKISTETSPDIEWLTWVLTYLQSTGRNYDVFSILRPTSPFRLSLTIQRAWQSFIEESHVESLRAVEKCKQHPGKMWVIQSNRLLPVLPYSINSTPWHSCQYAALPVIYSQNASLELAFTKTVFNDQTISGNVIKPFFTEGLEGFDINNPEDWILAEYYINTGQAKLPEILLSPYVVP